VSPGVTRALEERQRIGRIQGGGIRASLIQTQGGGGKLDLRPRVRPAG
jgi:hypothetical protein